MNRKHRQLRLTVSGHLEEWAANAGQADKNAVYGMLFAAADSTLLRAYEVVGERQHGGISVVVRPGLVVTLSFPRPGSFVVCAIGDREEVGPGTAEAV